MEQPKHETFRENIRRAKRIDEDEIDKFAKEGHFKPGDEPGTDTYDDGMNQKGQVIMPGSTSTGSGGTYMEEKGPNDLRRRNEGDLERVRADNLSVLEPGELGGEKSDIYEGNDPAARWLRKNDPEFKPKKRRGDMRKAP